MYKSLNKKEIKEFVKKYFEVWEGDIRYITYIEYGNIKECLINGHYFYTINS